MPKLGRSSTILAASLVIYAIYLPCALWIKADDEAKRRPVPVGAVVVHLGYFAPVVEDGVTDGVRATRHRFFQTVFRWTVDSPPPVDGASDPLINIYENETSIGAPAIFYVPYSKSYAASFHTSDDTDPRYNGRSYWIVRSASAID